MSNLDFKIKNILRRVANKQDLEILFQTVLKIEVNKKILLYSFLSQSVDNAKKFLSFLEQESFILNFLKEQDYLTEEQKKKIIKTVFKLNFKEMEELYKIIKTKDGARELTDSMDEIKIKKIFSGVLSNVRKTLFEQIAVETDKIDQIKIKEIKESI